MSGRHPNRHPPNVKPMGSSDVMGDLGAGCDAIFLSSLAGGWRCRLCRGGRRGKFRWAPVPPLGVIFDNPKALEEKTAPDKPRGARPGDALRAMEPGRGRGATSPLEIPWLGWKDILLRTYHEFNEDRVMTIAAGVVFYVLLAIFPAIVVFVSSTRSSWTRPDNSAAPGGGRWRHAG